PLHREVQPRGRLAVIDVADDRVVIEPGERAHFADEARTKRGIGDVLQRDRTPGALVDPTVDDPRPTLSDRFLHAVRPEATAPDRRALRVGGPVVPHAGSSELREELPARVARLDVTVDRDPRPGEHAPLDQLERGVLVETGGHDLEHRKRCYSGLTRR